MFVATMASMPVNTTTLNTEASSNTTISSTTSAHILRDMILQLIAVFNTSTFIFSLLNDSISKVGPEDSEVRSRLSLSNRFLSGLLTFFKKGQITTILAYLFFRVVMIFVDILSKPVQVFCWIIVTATGMVAFSGLISCLFQYLLQASKAKQHREDDRGVA